MARDAGRMRRGGPFLFAQVKHGIGVAEVVGELLKAWRDATHQPQPAD
jgi:urease accessory protein